MRKLALTAFAVLALAAPAQAAPSPHLGSFHNVHQLAGQRHRVYFSVQSTNHGDKACAVTLHARSIDVDLGTDGKSEVVDMFFLRVRGATIAYQQALAAPSPTSRIVCDH
jgi:hypothetical protein